MDGLEIRTAKETDLIPLLELYTHLHANAMPQQNAALDALWRRMLNDEGYHLLVGVAGGKLVSSCVLAVVPNLMQNQRPYALVENVVTHRAYRNRGCATKLLHAAKEIATENNCYKIMLMSGSKEESTLRFYERAGFNRNDKTAFVQWLD